MDNSTKELEKITRLMQFAEESLSQIYSRLESLASNQEEGQGGLAELWDRASLLKGNLANLEAQHQALIHSHFRI